MKTLISIKQLFVELTHVPTSPMTLARALLCCCVIGSVALMAYPDSVFASPNGISVPKGQKLSKQEATQARKERRQLRKLSKRQLREKMKKGDRIAGLAIADQFAAESSSLAATPVLANSAAEDAVRWYNLAARKGLRRSQSIVEVSVPAIRATRKRHK